MESSEIATVVEDQNVEQMNAGGINRILAKYAAISGAIALIVEALYYYKFPPVLFADKYMTIFINHLMGRLLFLAVFLVMTVFYIPRADMRKASICLCVIFLSSEIPGVPLLANPFLACCVLTTSFIVMNFIHKQLHPEQPSRTVC